MPTRRDLITGAAALAALIVMWLASSADARFCPIMCSGGVKYSYYVDSINGKDTNAGTALTQAKQNITALPTITAGQSVGLARGSYWQNQMLSLGTAANVTVAAYGNGNRPIIDSSATITNVSLTADGSGGYYTGTITFGYNGNGQGSGPWINFLEIGASGDSATGKLMTNVSSQALVDSTLCSYYIPGMTTGAGTPTSAIIYFHACDGTNPIINGYVYLYSNQRAAIYSSGGGNGYVSGIEGRNSMGKNGSFDFENNDGAGWQISNILARNCGDHCLVNSGGGTVSNSLFIDAYWGSQIATMVVDYETTASGKTFSSSGNIYQVDQLPSNSAGVTGIISHAASGTLGNIHSSNDWFIGKNGSAIIGSQIQYTSLFTMTGDNASQVSIFAQTSSTAANMTIANSQDVSTITNNQFVQIGGNSGTITLTNNKACLANDNLAVSIGTSAGVTLNDNGNVWYKQNTSVQQAFFGGSSAAITANNEIFDGVNNTMYPYDFYGTGATFAGGTSAGTANSYNSANSVGRFVFNNTTYTSLALWQAAVAPQDSAAITTATGSSACSQTVPNIQ